MDFFFLLLFFWIFQRSIFNLEKKAFVEENFFDHLEKVTGSTYHGIIFHFFFISQRCAHKLEKNWKNPVCIGVTKFANL